MLRGLSEDTLEQLYALGFNQYQAGKWDDAQKIFQALCMLDHYDARCSRPGRLPPVPRSL